LRIRLGGRLLVALTVVAAFLVAPTGAGASQWFLKTEGAVSGLLLGKGDVGQVNQVAIAIDPTHPDDVLIIDHAGIEGPIPSTCVRISDVAIRCPKSLIQRVIVRLGDGNDSFQIEEGAVGADADLFVDGGDGNDTISGRGGLGHDEFDGGKGRDVLSKAPLTGSGDPKSLVARTAARKGSSTMNGGADADKLTGAKGKDTLRGGKGPDRLVGRAGNDRMFGGAGIDFFLGGPGRDLALGGPGDDRGFSGPGNDHFVD
jgi:hypothetical protein